MSEPKLNTICIQERNLIPWFRQNKQNTPFLFFLGNLSLSTFRSALQFALTNFRSFQCNVIVGLNIADQI